MLFFEDLEVGQEFISDTYTVTREEIIEFAQKYDPQPFHLSEEQARDSMYKELIASGWHTASIFMKLSVESQINKTASMGSPGVDELRWKRPVKPGDTLHVKAKITDKKIFRKGIGMITHKGEVINQNGKIVMTVIGKGMIQTKDQ